VTDQIMKSALQEAMWAGDVDRLNELAPCRCCCAEHTFSNCEAREWGGCRGQGSEAFDDRAWQQFYEQAHGMSADVFYGQEEARL
jgi:hypothetical protein